MDIDIKPIIEKILQDPQNLSTPLELEQQAKACHAALLRADKDQNNIISIDEIDNLCNLLGLPLTNHDEDDLLTQYDRDQSGVIENIEFLTWWLYRISRQPGNQKQQELLASNTFELYDIDHSGAIDIEELNNLITSLGMTLTEKELHEAIHELDTDQSLKIEKNEFINWWINRTNNVRKGGGLIAYKLKKIINKAVQMYQTDLFTAVWKNQFHLIKIFLENEPNLINSLDNSTEYGNDWSILHYAVYRNYKEMIQYFLTIPLLNINIRNRDGFTPLFYAAQQNNIELCELLLHAGADPTLAGYDPNYPNTPPMCPIDHIIDSPDLLSLFSIHEKCIKPLDKPHIHSSKLSLEGCLTIEILNYGKISYLPIQQWIITFYQGNETIITINIKSFQLLNYNPIHHATSTSITMTCQPSVTDLELLMKSIAHLPSKERNHALEVDIKAVNALGEGDESSERCLLDLKEILG